MEADKNEIMKAQEVFRAVCNMLDSKEWNYKKDDDNFIIVKALQGEDIPMEFIIRVLPSQQIVVFTSVLPFKIEKEKWVDVAIACCSINYILLDGSFDFSIDDAIIKFRMTASYRDSLLNKELFEYMLLVSACTVDEYNDKLLMLSKGNLDIHRFLSSLNQ